MPAGKSTTRSPANNSTWAATRRPRRGAQPATAREGIGGWKRSPAPCGRTPRSGSASGSGSAPQPASMTRRATASAARMVSATLAGGVGHPSRPMAARLLAPSLALAATLAVAAPAGSHPGHGPPTIAISDLAYSPAKVTIYAGDAVLWVWNGPDTNHSVTGDGFDSDAGRPADRIDHKVNDDY